MLKIVEGYHTKLDIRETEKAIKFIKDNFERIFAEKLNLERISAPLFVDAASGLNDNLSGIERPVSFDVFNIENANCEIVQSLAKWKRLALYRYDFKPSEGIYTDMNAIRRDDSVDNIHSIYVDQWDWEKVINRADRNIEFLKDTVEKIVASICDCLNLVKARYPFINVNINRKVCFITTEELLSKYPNLSDKEREKAICKEYGTVFLMQIGDLLSNGIKHDGRAPDYDDWKLNGDILVYNELLDIAFELSSMGIRVDSTSMKEQLEKANCQDRAKINFHKSIIDDVLPLTMGGGIGQSRLCMLMLNKMHIGEVQASLWSDDMINECKRVGSILL